MDSSMRNMLVGASAGLGISLASIYAAIKFMRLQREADNSKIVKENQAFILKTQEENKKLREERDKLQRLLMLSEQSSVEIKEDSVHSTKLSVSEVEKLRAVFNMFDYNNEGRISLSGIQQLHEKLGEPLTDEEAADVIRSLDRDGSGLITFDKFLLWWYENHRGGRQNDSYTARFKLLSAKMQNSDFELDRLVRQESGEKNSLKYRVHYYYKQLNGQLKQLSPWHDIPLVHLGSGVDGQIFNFICEIPKWTRAKFEIATGEPFNPIKQDVKNGNLRFLKYGDYFFNYGALPQTWEDPKHLSEETGLKGDNDPIDVLELGTRQLKVGEVVPVKVLGILALIDDRETDWKIIAISIHDPLAALLNDIDDVEQHLPGAIDAIRTYFRQYKSWEGCINEFALNGQAMPKSFALNIIDRVHQQWNVLHKQDKINTV